MKKPNKKQKRNEAIPIQYPTQTGMSQFFIHPYIYPTVGSYLYNTLKDDAGLLMNTVENLKTTNIAEPEALLKSPEQLQIFIHMCGMILLSFGEMLYRSPNSNGNTIRDGKPIKDVIKRAPRRIRKILTLEEDAFDELARYAHVLRYAYGYFDGDLGIGYTKDVIIEDEGDGDNIPFSNQKSDKTIQDIIRFMYWRGGDGKYVQQPFDIYLLELDALYGTLRYKLNMDDVVLKMINNAIMLGDVLSKKVEEIKENEEIIERWLSKECI